MITLAGAVQWTLVDGSGVLFVTRQTSYLMLIPTAIYAVLSVLGGLDLVGKVPAPNVLLMSVWSQRKYFVDGSSNPARPIKTSCSPRDDQPKRSPDTVIASWLEQASTNVFFRSP
jgi:hypothetical protein